MARSRSSSVDHIPGSEETQQRATIDETIRKLCTESHAHPALYRERQHAARAFARDGWAAGSGAYAKASLNERSWVHLRASFEGHTGPARRDEGITLPLTAIARVAASKTMPDPTKLEAKRAAGAQGTAKGSTSEQSPAMVEAAPVAVLRTESVPGGAAAEGLSTVGKSASGSSAASRLRSKGGRSRGRFGSGASSGDEASLDHGSSAGARDVDSDNPQDVVAPPPAQLSAVPIAVLGQHAREAAAVARAAGAGGTGLGTSAGDQGERLPTTLEWAKHRHSARPADAPPARALLHVICTDLRSLRLDTSFAVGGPCQVQSIVIQSTGRGAHHGL